MPLAGSQAAAALWEGRLLTNGGLKILPNLIDECNRITHYIPLASLATFSSILSLVLLPCKTGRPIISSNW